jgi:glycosyltransferase involved in cell wall biosynthesis
MLVTVVSSDVSHNALSRALTLCELLARNFDVQLVGTRFGEDVWAPARERSMEVVPGSWFPLYAPAMLRLAQKVRGEIVIAVKPLIPSYGVALLTRKPVILDIDDDELAFRPAGHYASSLGHPHGRSWTRLAIALRHRARAIMVATTGLQQRFGGTIVPHARDTNRMRPLPEARAAARALLGAGNQPLVMFAGTPRPFKGLEDAVAAMRLMRHDARLAIVGADPHTTPIEGAILRPQHRLEDTAFLLAAADVVIVPQRLTAATAMQLPAKLVDAMSAARPIVATDVADNATILAGGRGVIVPPSEPEALARALDSVLDDPRAAAEMGARARAWCEQHMSVDALAPVVADVVRRVVTRAAAS